MISIRYKKGITIDKKFKVQNLFFGKKKKKKVFVSDNY